MARVVLAMSGGVDSSVAAHLLLQEGYEVIGVFMRHGDQSLAACATTKSSDPTSSAGLPIVTERLDHKQGCCSAADAQDARRVADQLDIPFYAINFQAEFGQIIDYFVDQYTHGRTPNPCIVCNQWLKFGKLFDYADSVDAQYVATGHYARCILAADGTPWLCRGVDHEKDQSYVLFGIELERFHRMLLPVGQFHKPEIRAMAANLGLRVADKRDSQEICFVTSGHHGEFVQQRRGQRNTAGRIVTADGAIVGQHRGIERFTVGQRKGLGVALGEPYFVIRIDPVTNDVVIGRRDQLACHELLASQTNWLASPPTGPFRCRAKIRYNSAPTAATASVLAENRLHVRFDEPVFGVAPGQAVVCYDGDRVLGGGWIENDLT
jgi:tRNA-specific 2-thiouridylase